MIILQRNKFHLLINPAEIVVLLPPSLYDQSDKETQNEIQRNKICMMVAECDDIFEYTKNKIIWKKIA